METQQHSSIDVLALVNMKVTDFGDMTLCNALDGSQRFGKNSRNLAKKLCAETNLLNITALYSEQDNVIESIFPYVVMALCLIKQSDKFSFVF